MSSEAPTAEAVDSFRSKLCAGDMVGAFWTIKQLRPEDAAALMLRAGFGVAFDRKRNVKHFWERTQADIAEACRRNTDGYGLYQERRADCPSPF